ncbi:MAG: diaminopimelate epimerase [Gemmatimonadaceae bacterium]|nr:diaminopimelate epimerase [Gemmatimonadaceae bacterium]
MKGRRFWKMSGSGNDFVFFDAMRDPAGELATPPWIGRLCERRTGIGADGVVFLEPHPLHAFSMRYFNRDGSLAEMCGNAALCSTRLARMLGIAPEGSFTFETVSGSVTGRFVAGMPEIDMIPVTELAASFETALEPGEQRIGFARVGVPHLVLLVSDLEGLDVFRRGRALRHLEALRDGANANFVMRDEGDRWWVRTYERGVEEETLACGTGSVAVAALLTAWGLIDGRVALRTRSGRDLVATVNAEPEQGTPVLAGEGRIVFEGTLGEF